MTNNIPLKDLEINYLNTNISIILNAKKNLVKNPEYATELPLEIGLQLTNTCNLRCKVCYEWNDEGFFRKKVKSEIPFEIIEKIIHETEESKSRLFLWGGEPLLYTKWDQLINLLKEHPRESVICTNGTLLDKKIESILELPIKPNFLIGLDGLEKSNDLIRGNGSFKRIMANTDKLLNLKRDGLLTSNIAFNTVLTESNIREVENLISFLENKGVDTLFLCLPWYINSSLAGKFDDYLAENSLFLNGHGNDTKGSWYSYTFCLEKRDVNNFYDSYEKIIKKNWKIRVKLSPKLTREKALEFITGEVDAGNLNKKCMAMTHRVDITADGSVGTCCKFYPELFIDNLNNSSLRDLWHSNTYKHLRRTVNTKLMPICNYCYLLHHYEK